MFAVRYSKQMHLFKSLCQVAKGVSLRTASQRPAIHETALQAIEKYAQYHPTTLTLKNFVEFGKILYQ